MAQRTRHGLYGGPRRLYGSFAGKLQAVGVPPPDRDDQDAAGNTLTYTVFTGGDGYQIRPPRFEVMHSVDSGVNADIAGYERLGPDRFHALSNRIGHLPTFASNSLRPFMVAKRAGERFGIAALRIRVDVHDPGPTIVSRQSENTDTHTGGDGYQSRYPTWRGFLSTDSGQDSALEAAGTDRDRDRVAFMLPRGKSVAYGSGRFKLETDGRAGNRFGIYAIRVLVNVTNAPEPKAKEI